METLEEETDDLQEVMKVCVERCWGMSQFITKFADVVKIPDPNIELVRLNDRVIACGMFMETICRERQITLHNELCVENPKVWIDTVLFEQVLVNIIKNAAESIGQGGIFLFVHQYLRSCLKLPIPEKVSVRRWKRNCSVRSFRPNLTGKVSD